MTIRCFFKGNSARLFSLKFQENCAVFPLICSFVFIIFTNVKEGEARAKGSNHGFAVYIINASHCISSARPTYIISSHERVYCLGAYRFEAGVRTPQHKAHPQGVPSMGRQDVSRDYTRKTSQELARFRDFICFSLACRRDIL